MSRSPSSFPTRRHVFLSSVSPCRTTDAVDASPSLLAAVALLSATMCSSSSCSNSATWSRASSTLAASSVAVSAEHVALKSTKRFSVAPSSNCSDLLPPVG